MLYNLIQSNFYKYLRVLKKRDQLNFRYKFLSSLHYLPPRKLQKTK